MSIFQKFQSNRVERDEVNGLRERVRDLENKVSRLQRDITCAEDESMGEFKFLGLDLRPRVNLKSVVLALVEHLGMDIKVEPAKPPSARVEPKEKGYVAERERGGKE